MNDLPNINKLDLITQKVMNYDPAKPKSLSNPLKVIAGATDRPLVIGEVEIPCYVLEDETRVLSQRGLFNSINATRGSLRTVSERGAEMPRFAAQKWLKPFISNDLAMVLKKPILFRFEGIRVYGYPAISLVDICNAILDAESAGATTDRQRGMVDRANILIRSFAKVGIIALVDEATGYQRIREERALATILNKIIAKELQPWTKTFPFDFYKEICRLKKWPDINAIKRPSVIGRYTNDIVYDRLAPGVLNELRKANPVDPSTKRRKSRHHQWFTTDLGHPKLKQHLEAVMALMRISNSWDSFLNKLNVAYPKPGDNYSINFDNE